MMCFIGPTGDVQVTLTADQAARYGRAMDAVLTGHTEDLNLKDLREMRIKLRCAVRFRDSMEGKDGR